MAASRPNQIRYNNKISKIREAIAREKLTFIDAVKSDIEKLLQRRSPEDIGDLKKSWRVVMSGRSKLAGKSIEKLSQARPIVIGISIESTSRHAVMQMFGWTAKPGQLLTGYKVGGKWRITRASRPIFNLTGRGAGRKRDRRKSRSFVTKGGPHKPDPNLAFDGGTHSIKSEIKRIIAKRLKDCRYLSQAVFASKDVASVWSGNNVRGRIAKWMEGTLNVELNSRATKGIKFGQGPASDGEE